MREKNTEQTLYRLGWGFISVCLVAVVIMKCCPDIVRVISFPCVFNRFTGYYCPGCGGTRAVVYFIKGHWIKSFIYHPLVPYLGIGGGLYMITHTISHITKGKIRGIRFRLGYVYIMGIIIGVQFLVKNAIIYIWGIHII